MRDRRKGGTSGLRKGWGLNCREFDSGFYAVEIMASIVLLQKARCVQLVFWFPCVVGFRVSFPFEEILKSFFPSKMAVTSDGFYFILRFTVDKVRWGSREVGAVGICFDVWG
jgi:hypothetical protein